MVFFLEIEGGDQSSAPPPPPHKEGHRSTKHTLVFPCLGVTSSPAVHLDPGWDWKEYIIIHYWYTCWQFTISIRDINIPAHIYCTAKSKYKKSFMTSFELTCWKSKIHHVFHSVTFLFGKPNDPYLCNILYMNTIV